MWRTPTYEHANPSEITITQNSSRMHTHPQCNGGFTGVRVTSSVILQQRSCSRPTPKCDEVSKISDSLQLEWEVLVLSCCRVFPSPIWSEKWRVLHEFKVADWPCLGRTPKWKDPEVEVLAGWLSLNLVSQFSFSFCCEQIVWLPFPSKFAWRCPCLPHFSRVQPEHTTHLDWILLLFFWWIHQFLRPPKTQTWE